MRASAILLQKCLRLTMFTRPNCSLCDDAKRVIDKVWQRRPFEFDQIDVMQRNKWKVFYEFDVPVLHLDVTEENNHAFETTPAARKLKHRFTEAELETAMDQAIGSKEVD